MTDLERTTLKILLLVTGTVNKTVVQAPRVVKYFYVYKLLH